ncbi:MAG: sigma factor [Terrimicrobiaceae bacterium]|nr:sigma factor [Terrimicrobiaceae bacterium]
MPASAESSSPRPLFLTTRWSVVLAARTGGDGEHALETLCRTYWYPLYAFVRSRGHPPADAQDLTQEFFARLLSRNYLDGVAPERGRFRTFLRMALQRFLANEWDRARAQKRGGGCVHVPFDAGLAERRLSDEREGPLPPDRIYDRRWALALLDDAAARLEAEYAAAGKSAEFLALKPHLTAGRGEIPYADVAAALQTSGGAARVAIHRLRRRFRESFRQAVADTVSSPEELETEMREVLAVLGNR